MALFRKKPVVIEALPVSSVHRALTVAIDPVIPTWLSDAYMAGVVCPKPGGALQVRTLEGVMQANPDDWLIRGVAGELYPCKPDIFAATYDRVEE